MSICSQGMGRGGGGGGGGMGWILKNIFGDVALNFGLGGAKNQK